MEQHMFTWSNLSNMLPDQQLHKVAGSPSQQSYQVQLGGTLSMFYLCVLSAHLSKPNPTAVRSSVIRLLLISVMWQCDQPPDHETELLELIFHTLSNSNLFDSSLLIPLPSKVFSVCATITGCCCSRRVMMLSNFLNSWKKASWETGWSSWSVPSCCIEGSTIFSTTCHKYPIRINNS